MFGYVRPRRSELKIKEFDYYKSVYCGLCHAEKKLARSLRYTLSYDMVTLALVRIGVMGECSSFEKKKCIAHPLKGCLCTVRSEALAYTASCAAILVYYKLLDDIADERGFRKLVAKHMLRGAKKAMAASPIPSLEATVRDKLNALAVLERARAESVYDGASVFGELLGEVFAHGIEGKRAEALRSLGFHMGQFIYMMDAYADMGEDRKKGRYNPFLLSGGEEDSESFNAAVINAADWEVSLALEAWDSLAVADQGIDAILRNILALGLPDAAEKIVLKKETLPDPKKNKI